MIDKNEEPAKNMEAAETPPPEGSPHRFSQAAEPPGENETTYPIDFSQVEKALREDISAGWCISCGRQHEQVEPDAEDYRCEECGTRTVYGAEELILRGWYR